MLATHVPDDDPARLDDDAMTPHLALWNAVDPAAPPADIAPWLARAAEVPAAGGEDTHRRFVERFDGPQHGDPSRTARYLAALDEVRARADASEPLSLAALARVQSGVLGLTAPAAPLRTTDAFGRGGAHRYPYVAHLEELVVARLSAWTAPAIDPLVAATGLYLDVIFTHPFCDGNARAARLGYEWTLRRARRALPRFEDLLRVRRTPGDEDAFWRLVRIGAVSTVGARRARCGGAP